MQAGLQPGPGGSGGLEIEGELELDVVGSAVVPSAAAWAGSIVTRPTSTRMNTIRCDIMDSLVPSFALRLFIFFVNR